MNKEMIDDLFEAITAIVEADAMWTDKAEELIGAAEIEDFSDTLNEFLSWFGGDLEDEGA